MFCKNCGTQIKDGAAFCHNCGAVCTEGNVNAAHINESTHSPAQNSSTTINGVEQFPSTASEPFPNTATEPYVNTVSQPNSNVPNYAAPAEETDKGKSGFAIASLVLSIVGVPAICCCCIGPIFSILGLIFGILGRKSDKKSMATAGIIISIVSLALFIIFWAVMFITDNVNVMLDSFNEGFNEGLNQGMGGMYY